MKPSQTTLATLILAAAIGIATSVYQWLALLALRTSGEKPLCAVNEALDCSAVWNSPLSTYVHQYSGIPIAGWGLIWAILILILAFKLVLDIKNEKDYSLTLSSLRIAALIGLAGIVGLAAYSASIQVFCLSCIIYYLVVAVIGFTVLTKLKPITAQIIPGAGLALAISVILALILYLPGQNTPLESVFNQSLSASDAKKVEKNSKATTTAPENSEKLAQFIASQPPAVTQAMSDFLEEYRKAKRLTHESDPARLSFGDTNAPVKVIEWLEITCPHCAQLDQQLAGIKNSTNEKDWSLETRYYPLDSECNPHMNRSRNNGVSCLAAKSLICLSEDREKSHSIRATFFANQKQLSTTMIRDIIRDHNVDMTALTACIESDTTADELADDIEMAQAHNISGTPLVVMNGRPLTAMPHLIYSLILSAADDAAPEFGALPAPKEISHAGHDH